jgi:hypothetical protein
MRVSSGSLHRDYAFAGMVLLLRNLGAPLLPSYYWNYDDISRNAEWSLKAYPSKLYGQRCAGFRESYFDGISLGTRWRSLSTAIFGHDMIR